MGNPPIFPLIYDTASSDVLIVQINPMNVDAVPKRAHDIMDRVNEVSFNSSLMRELRTIAFVTRLIDEGRLDIDRYKRLNMHAIEGEDELAQFTVSSKHNAERGFLRWLFELGRRRAETWLDAHADKVGRESSLDLQRFL